MDSTSSSDVSHSQHSPPSALQDEIDLTKLETEQWPPPLSDSSGPLSKPSKPILIPSSNTSTVILSDILGLKQLRQVPMVRIRDVKNMIHKSFLHPDITMSRTKRANQNRRKQAENKVNLTEQDIDKLLQSSSSSDNEDEVIDLTGPDDIFPH